MGLGFGVSSSSVDSRASVACEGGGGGRGGEGKMLDGDTNKSGS